MTGTPNTLQELEPLCCRQHLFISISQHDANTQKTLVCLACLKLILRDIILLTSNHPDAVWDSAENEPSSSLCWRLLELYFPDGLLIL